MQSPGRSALLVIAGLALAGGASAQGMHPLPAGPRPLHVRMAEADAVAIGRVAEIGEGRIAVRDAVALRGAPGASFEVKRAPSQAPALAVGAQAVFLLRGARSPYVLIDAPPELLVLRDEESAAAWRAALARILDAGDDPARLLPIYLAWLDGDDESMRHVAGAALLDPRGKLTPLAAQEAVARAHVALDSSKGIEVRRVSARLAGTNQAGAGALLAGIPDASPDAQIVNSALSAGSLLKAPELEAALERALANEDVEVRRAALRVASSTWSDRLAAMIRDLSEHEPDPALRAEAASALLAHAQPERR
jgi:hypothetical protein